MSIAIATPPRRGRPLLLAGLTALAASVALLAALDPMWGI
jgi:hypothetical protein